MHVPGILRFCASLAVLAAVAPAQETGVVDPFREAAKAAEKRIRDTGDGVIITYGLAVLGSQTCTIGKPGGTRLVRDSFAALRALPADGFDLSSKPFLLSSFTAAAKLVAESAQVCGVGSEILNDRSVNLRLVGQWLKCNIWLTKALQAADVSRAVQLADAAISVCFASREGSVLRIKALQYGRKYDFPPEVVYDSKRPYLQIAPDALDLSLLSRVLARVKKSAPDLAGSLFRKTFQLMQTQSPPTAAEFSELPRYLFPTDSFIHLPVDERWSIVPSGGLPTPNFRQATLNADVDLAAEFLSQAAEVVLNYSSTSADQLDAYALVCPGLSDDSEITRVRTRKPAPL